MGFVCYRCDFATGSAAAAAACLCRLLLLQIDGAAVAAAAHHVLLLLHVVGVLQVKLERRFKQSLLQAPSQVLFAAAATSACILAATLLIYADTLLSRAERAAEKERDLLVVDALLAQRVSKIAG